LRRDVVALDIQPQANHRGVALGGGLGILFARWGVASLVSFFAGVRSRILLDPRFDLHVSIVSNRLNVIIKRLTVLATVGLPLTIITSYYGMNFALPEYRWAHPELLVLGLMALSALATWVLLKWTRWM